jgi:hypothetical protein
MQPMKIGNAELLPSKATVAPNPVSGQAPASGDFRVKWADALTHAGPTAQPQVDGHVHREPITSKAASQALSAKGNSSPVDASHAGLETKQPSALVKKNTEGPGLDGSDSDANPVPVTVLHAPPKGMEDSAIPTRRTGGQQKVSASPRRATNTSHDNVANAGICPASEGTNPNTALPAQFAPEVAIAQSSPLPNSAYPGSMPSVNSAVPGQSEKAIQHVLPASTAPITLQNATGVTQAPGKAETHHAERAVAEVVSQTQATESVANVHAMHSAQDEVTQHSSESPAISIPLTEPKVEGSSDGRKALTASPEVAPHPASSHVLQVIASGPAQLEVGVLDGTHGWLKIRAELSAGGTVDATLGVNAAAHEHLRATLPAMTAYLGSEAVKVNTIAMHRLDARAAAGDGAGMPNSGGRGTEAEQQQPEKSFGAATVTSRPQQEEASEIAAAPAASRYALMRFATLPLRWPIAMQGNNTGTWLSVCA